MTHTDELLICLIILGYHIVVIEIALLIQLGSPVSIDPQVWVERLEVTTVTMCPETT